MVTVSDHWIQPGVTCVFGQTYSGKTTFLLKLLRARRGVRALIFDPSSSAALNSLPSLRSWRAVSEFLTSKASKGSWIRTVRFADPSLYGRLAATSPKWRGITWVLDDGAALMQDPQVRDAAVMVSITGRHMGHGRGVELWFIGHRPKDAPIKIRAQITVLHSFVQTEPDDLKFLAQKAGDLFARRVQTAKVHEVVSWPDTAAMPNRGASGRRRKQQRASR